MKTPYRGRFPNGFMERLETLLYVFNLIPDFNPHKTLMLFPFGGSVVKRPNLHTIDIKSVTTPTFCGDVTSRAFMDRIPNNAYKVAVIDPPYDAENITYSDKLYRTNTVRPYDFVSANPKRVNVVEKLEIGGIVAILHQLVYKLVPGCVRLGVLGITTGPNMRIRALNLFKKVEHLKAENYDSNSQSLETFF